MERAKDPTPQQLQGEIRRVERRVDELVSREAIESAVAPWKYFEAFWLTLDSQVKQMVILIGGYCVLYIVLWILRRWGINE